MKDTGAHVGDAARDGVGGRDALGERLVVVDKLLLREVEEENAGVCVEDRVALGIDVGARVGQIKRTTKSL